MNYFRLDFQFDRHSFSHHDDREFTSGLQNTINVIYTDDWFVIDVSDYVTGFESTTVDK